MFDIICFAKEKETQISMFGFLFLSQRANWWTPASVSRGGVCVAADTFPNAAPARLAGCTGTHAAELWDIQRERSRRQGLHPQQPALPAQPDSTDSSTGGRKTHSGSFYTPDVVDLIKRWRSLNVMWISLLCKLLKYKSIQWKCVSLAFGCSIHSWDPPPPVWPPLCPLAAVSVRLQPCSSQSTCRSWRRLDSVRGVCQIMKLWWRVNHLPFCLTLPVLTLLDESSELQTQICNSFKSLLVQLQGEQTAGFLHQTYNLFWVWCACPLLLSTEILNKCKGDFLEMNESKLKTQPSFLENLIFFVEVKLLCFHTKSFCLYFLHNITLNGVVLHRRWA